LEHRELKRTFVEVAKAGEPLMQQALDAMRRYHEARDSLISAQEVERLRLVAESLYQAVNEYQLHALGGEGATRH
jgi:hypothetical protein